jgi:prolyl oligopeptidase
MRSKSRRCGCTCNDPPVLPRHHARPIAGVAPLRHAVRCAAMLCLLTLPTAMITADETDAHRWLEDVQGEAALAWVREQNAKTQAALEATPGFEALRSRLLAILDSRDRIPGVVRRGDWLYNFWQDAAQPRGLWRRTTLAEYRQAQPRWETVLDLDALAAAEGENWVWGGADCLGPDYRRCLISLSRGGADASVVREFDSVSKAFLADGFQLPEAKSDVTWIDADHVYVGTDFGAGSLTDSGYPRIIKRWARGTPLADASTVFEAETGDVSASVSVDHTPGFGRVVFARSVDFYHEQRFLAGPDGLAPFDVPSDASWSFWHSAGATADTLLLELRSDLVVGTTTYARGSLLAADAAGYLAGRRDFRQLFAPSATRSLAGYVTTRSHLIVNVLDNVASRLEAWQRGDGASFTRREIDAPYPGTLSVSTLHDPLLRDDPLAERYLLASADFLTPDTLWLARAATDERERLKARPEFFDAGAMHVAQFFARSRDGTRVPYFVVFPNGVSEATPADGSRATLLYGYGGFEVSMQPWYSAAFGAAWFERGGVLAVANIRGGGEFGPAWHQAALKADRQRSYDDFIAVAEDLIARRITSPRHLGIEGGSNGGLLVGAVAVQRPELFNAVVCQVPLLDMRRYHRLLAGASWLAEYGDPDDPAQWAFIARYSPYHNVRADARYPKMLFTTSTRDDRVHPAHARKMAARLLEQGHDMLYYENIEGGHGGAADNPQRAYIQALEFSYLWQQLGPR